MRKRYSVTILSILTAFACLCLSACGETSTAKFGGSYFLANSGERGVASINETCTYNVTFTQAENAKVGLSVTDGTYTTSLSNGVYNDTECYVLATTLSVKGEYDVSGTATPFEDEVTTVAYFLGVKDNLKTLHSERNVKAHAPVADETGNFTVEYYEYALSTDYGDSTATVTFTPSDASTAKTDLDAGQVEYKRYNKSQYYFDNEIMLFMPRAIKIVDGATMYFDSIDGLSKTKRSMTFTQNAEAPSEELALEGYYRDSMLVKKVPTQICLFSVKGTFSGTKITCWYAKTTSDSKERNRLIKMQTVAPYSIGTYVYTIVESNVTLG